MWCSGPMNEVEALADAASTPLPASMPAAAVTTAAMLPRIVWWAS